MSNKFESWIGMVLGLLALIALPVLAVLGMGKIATRIDRRLSGPNDNTPMLGQ